VNEIRPSRLVAASPVYYGWVILAVGTLGGIMTSPGQTYAVSVFIDYFIKDLGLSRSLVSTLYSAGTLTASFALPFVGRQFDRRGARLMIALFSLLLGLACIYMGFVRNAMMLGLGFFALRLLGQGSLSLVSKNAINQWWVRRRGMAMGISGVAAALLGLGGFPTLINWLIGLAGWREAYFALGLILLLLMFPLGWIFIRNRPEEYGLVPDGMAGGEGEGEDGGFVEENWTLAEALRTPAFWLVSAGLAAMSMLNTGLTFHLFSIFKDSGLSSTVAASVFIPIAATGALAQLGSGILIDRVSIRLMLALALLIEAVVLVMAPMLSSVEMALGFGVLMGVQGGIEMIIASVVWPQYFGRLHMGSITGLASTLQVGASALGPMPFGIARDLVGSYTSVLTGFAALPLLLGVVTLIFCKRPSKIERGGHGE
jgi:sugar phosphate permease